MGRCHAAEERKKRKKLNDKRDECGEKGRGAGAREGGEERADKDSRGSRILKKTKIFSV